MERAQRTQFCQQSWSWSCAAFPFAGLPFNCLTIFLWFLEHSHTQSLIGSRLHLAKENAVAVDVAVDGCACRLSCQFIFYNNSHKYRHAQRNDSKSTNRQTERDRNRVAEGERQASQRVVTPFPLPYGKRGRNLQQLHAKHTHSHPSHTTKTIKHVQCGFVIGYRDGKIKHKKRKSLGKFGKMLQPN